MAKKHWIQDAVPEKNKGKFSAKARRAGMSTIAYAHKEAKAPGKLGEEARFAARMIGYNRRK